MRILVDELPKNCFDCFCSDDYFGCNLGCQYSNCPLQTIEEYEQQKQSKED